MRGKRENEGSCLSQDARHFSFRRNKKKTPKNKVTRTPREQTEASLFQRQRFKKTKKKRRAAIGFPDWDSPSPRRSVRSKFLLLTTCTV